MANHSGTENAKPLPNNCSNSRSDEAAHIGNSVFSENI